MCCIILIGLIALGVIATPIILKFVNTWEIIFILIKTIPMY